MDDIRPRCGWCNLSNPVYVAYHDAEWAVPSHDDHHLFEMLVLETFQAGLSWETILNKRKRFRQAFDGFDIERIRRYDENKIAELMNDPGIIRNRRKIVATVGNANAFRDIQTSYGSFDDYIWRPSPARSGKGTASTPRRSCGRLLNRRCPSCRKRSGRRQ